MVTNRETRKASAPRSAKWVCFYGPEEKCLCAYTIKGTFAGEMEATKELLAGENGIRVSDIQVRLENRAPKKR